MALRRQAIELFADGMRNAIKLFVHAWNRCQVYRRTHPKYAAHVFQLTYQGL